MSRKGEIVIPKTVRGALDWREGAVLDGTIQGDALVLRQVAVVHPPGTTVAVPARGSSQEDNLDVGPTDLDSVDWESGGLQSDSIATAKLLLKAFNSPSPLDAEELVHRTGLAVSEVLASLTLLEIKGVIRGLPGQLFVPLRAKTKEGRHPCSSGTR